MAAAPATVWCQAHAHGSRSNGPQKEKANNDGSGLLNWTVSGVMPILKLAVMMSEEL